MHVREIRTGNREPDRIGSGGEEESVIGVPGAILQVHVCVCYVDCGHAPAQPQVDLVLGIECRRSKQVRLVGCGRSEEHTSELQSLMRTSYAVFCLKKKNS